MSLNTLLSPYAIGATTLSNRIVMSPMTRNRALNNIPNQLMAEYYSQRAAAGLIITEGTSPSPNGLGYARIPGIFSQQQVEGWKLVTKAVHDKGGKIFVQLMHTGRLTNSATLPAGGKVLAPSAVQAAGEVWTDDAGKQPYPMPEAMTSDELADAKKEFLQAAQNAIAAGFDGIELHGANGYLLEQFISPHTNRREDEYGGSIDNRSRFVLEVAADIAKAIGKEKLGIRISPHGVNGDMVAYDAIAETYTYLAEQLNAIGIAYIHIADHSAMGAPEVPVALKQKIREVFTNTLILAGGYDRMKAEADLEAKAADLIAFGRPFINNPDLVTRFIKNLPLNSILDASTFYSATAKGYIDYSHYSEEKATA